MVKISIVYNIIQHSVKYIIVQYNGVGNCIVL